MFVEAAGFDSDEIDLIAGDVDVKSHLHSHKLEEFGDAFLEGAAFGLAFVSLGDFGDGVAGTVVLDLVGLAEDAVG